MKKLFILLILCASVSFLFAQGAPSRTAVDGLYEWEIDSALATSATDTLAAADSSTICTKYKFEQGWEYVLQRNAFTGTGSDSVSVYLRADIYTITDTFLYSSTVDSFTSSTGESVILPFNRSIFGKKGTLKIIGYGDDGGQLITNYWAIIKRRPVTAGKNWQ